jgi:c-di-GMP-binding flagellar brake protein YcgR
VPKGEIFSEKRTYKRMSKNFAITYQIMSSTSEITEYSEEGKIADCLNLSTGGVGLITDENLSVGQIIEIKFVLEGKGRSITTCAEVRWAKHDDKINKYREGIEFLALKEEDKNLIKKIIK